MNKIISCKDIINLSESPTRLIGNTHAQSDKIASIDSAMAGSLTWISTKTTNYQELLKNTLSSIVIAGWDFKIEPDYLPKNLCVILVADPRLLFVRVVETFYATKITPEIHPTSVIHPCAEIGANVYIGPGCIIGKSKVGDGSILWGNIFVYDNVVIGSNVIIHAGTVVGSDGFGFARNARGKLEKFPHIGTVEICDNVEIGASNTIDRATLGSTVIGRGTKTDNKVHIAHNVQIGSDCLITANCMIAGSVRIGDRVWLGPSSSISSKLNIGDDAYITIGSVVTKDVAVREKVTGNFAIPHSAFMADLKERKRKFNF